MRCRHCWTKAIASKISSGYCSPCPLQRAVQTQRAGHHWVFICRPVEQCDQCGVGLDLPCCKSRMAAQGPQADRVRCGKALCRFVSSFGRATLLPVHVHMGDRFSPIDLSQRQYSPPDGWHLYSQEHFGTYHQDGQHFDSRCRLRVLSHSRCSS